MQVKALNDTHRALERAKGLYVLGVRSKGLRTEAGAANRAVRRRVPALKSIKVRPAGERTGRKEIPILMPAGQHEAPAHPQLALADPCWLEQDEGQRKE